MASSSTPNINIKDSSTDEGGFLRFKIILDKTATQDVRVNYVTQSASASYKTDYQAKKGTATIKRGYSYTYVTIATTEDSIVENAEYMKLILSNASYGKIADSQAIGIIRDDDKPVVTPPNISIDNATANEGDLLRFKIVLSKAATQNISIKYDTYYSTASSSTDYYGKHSTVTINSGSSYAYVYVSTREDKTVESTEKMYLKLSNASYGKITDNQATGTIYDDDKPVVTPPNIKIYNVIADEGNSLRFKIYLDKAATQDVTLKYSTQGVSASSSTDYYAKSGTLTISRGSSYAYVTIATKEDSIVENTEQMYLNLSNASYGKIADNRGVGYIRDDDKPVVTPPNIKIYNAIADEGNSLRFRVYLDKAATQDVTLKYSTQGVSASSSTDYYAKSGTLTINSGSSYAYVTIATKENSIVENTEQMYLNLSNASYGKIADNRGVGYIRDDDKPVVTPPSIRIYNAISDEGNSLRFRVYLDKAATQDVTLKYSTQGVSASSSTDYYAKSGTLTISRGSSYAYVTIATKENSIVENTEQMYLNLSNASYGKIADNRGVGYIRDDDKPVVTPPNIKIYNAIADEGNSLRFRVYLDKAATQDVTLKYSTQGVSASSSTDYYAKSGTLTISRGSSYAYVTIATKENSIVENTEQMYLNLSNASYGKIADNRGVGYIRDDDKPVVTPPNIRIYNAIADEGNSLRFRVYLDKAATQDVTLKYSTQGVSASSSTDYYAKSGTLTISRGSSYAYVTIATKENSIVENTEQMYLNLSNASYGKIADNRGVGYIRDDDKPVVTPPSIRIYNAISDEGNSLRFRVYLDKAATQDVTLKYSTQGVSASSSTDYYAKSGTLTISRGSSYAYVTIATKENSIVENTEQMYLNLSSASYGKIADNRGVGYIRDDDKPVVTPPSIRIYNAISDEGNSLRFRVYLDKAATQDVTLKYSTQGVSASSSTDYYAKSGTLTISRGSSYAYVTIATKENSIVENTEQMYLNLSSASYGKIADNRGIGYIRDDDKPVVTPPSIRIYNAISDEGNSLRFRVYLDKAATQDVTLKYSTQGVSASSSTDYYAKSGTLTISRGSSYAYVTIATKEDSIVENTEKMYLNLSNASYGKIADNRGIGTIRDDDKPVVTPPTPQYKTSSQLFGDQYFASMGMFSQAAYKLGNWEPTGKFYNTGSQQNTAYDNLKSKGWSFLSQDELSVNFSSNTTAVNSRIDANSVERTSIFRNHFSEGIYTFGNSAALVARAKDALIVSFRGTNDNISVSLLTATPDTEHWNEKDEHYKQYADLFDAITKYTSSNKDITKIYVTGHSLGAAMAQNYIGNNNSNSLFKEAVVFAMPHFYGSTDVGNKLTAFEVEGDVVPDSGLNRGKTVHMTVTKAEENIAGGKHSMDLYYESVQLLESSISSKGISDLKDGTKALIGSRYADINHGGTIKSYDLAVLGNGNDSIQEQNISTIYSGAHNDTVRLASTIAKNSAYEAHGGDGVDTLTGGNNIDTIYGDAGDDILQGNKEDDNLHGGRNNDTYIYNFGDGNDVISEDGLSGNDKLIIYSHDNIGLNNFDKFEEDLRFSRSSNNLKVEIARSNGSSEGSITIKNMNNVSSRIETLVFQDDAFKENTRTVDLNSVYTALDGKGGSYRMQIANSKTAYGNKVAIATAQV